MVLRCASCGASVTHESSECPYCGATRAAAAPPPGPAPEPTIDDRLAAVREHPGFATLMRLEPSVSGHLAGAGCGVVFMVVFIGVAIFMTAMFQAAPAPMSWFPLLFVGFGIFGLVSMVRKTSRFASAPLERAPAQVLDERVAVSGGGENSSARTTYYVTLVREGGARREYETTGKVAGDVVRDDVGVAYVKGDFLLDFRRVAD